MGTIFCQRCGKEIEESSTFCQECGAPAKVVQQQVSSVDELPAGIRGWSWGAFLLNFIWAIGNRVWIGLLVLIPFVGWIFAFWLGFKGREMAWKLRRWDSVEHFQIVQKKWSKWGVIITVVLFLFGLIAAVVLPAYKDYQTKARTNEGVTTLLCIKAPQTVQFQDTKVFSQENIYKLCNIASLPRGIKALGMASGDSAIEATVFFEGDGLEDGAISLFGEASSSGDITWRCISGTIKSMYMPRSCEYDSNWKVHTMPYQTLEEYKANAVVAAAKPASSLPVAPVVQPALPVSDTQQSVAISAVSAPASVASQNSNAAASTPMIVVPSVISGPIVISSGFIVVAPDESKQLLTAMLQQATSAFKISEIKGKIEAFAKPSNGDRKAARKLNEQGLAALKSDDIPQAVIALKSAIATDPADVEILNNYVYALIKANRLQDAASEAGRLLTISPGRSSAWANLAEVYALENKNEEAVAALVLAFQFSSNKDRTVTFLNDRAGDMNSPLQATAKKAIEVIQKM